MTSSDKILIAGHQGYIGPIVISLLRKSGYQVLGLDTGYYCDDLYYPLDGPPVETIRIDLRDADVSCLNGVKAVVNLAGLSNDPLGDLNPTLTEAINVDGCKRLADFAKKAGVGRFVFASSCSVYGAASQHQTPLDEQAPCNPVSAYAVSKLAVERHINGLADDGFSPVSLRFATAYGLSPRLRLDLVVNNLMAHAYLTGVVRVLSDGTPWRPLTHVQDIAMAVRACLTAPQSNIHRQSFNIGRNDANYQVKDIAEVVARKVPGAKLEITGESGGDPRSYKVDFSKARAALPDFDPQWTLQRGVDELYEAFLTYGLPPDALQAPSFIRLKRLRKLLDDNLLRPDLYWAAAA